MNDDAASSDLLTIQNDIICESSYAARIRFNPFKILYVRGCEWMMASFPPLRVFIPLKQREIMDVKETDVPFKR